VFPTNVELARAAYRESLAPGMAQLGQRTMADRFGITVRQARALQDEVKRDLAAEEWAQAAAEDLDVAIRHTPNGRVHTGTAPDQPGQGGQ
jgi:hypothetical protein